MSRINTLDYVLIEQKPFWCEKLLPGCCEKENEYTIYNSGPNFLQNEQIGSFIETASKSERCFCCCLRSYNMDLKLDQESAISYSQKSFACPILCMPKPKLKVYSSRGDLGNISQRYIWHFPKCRGGCCSMQELDVENFKGEKIYRISGKCCQPGYMCQIFDCFENCSKTEYGIFDMAGQQVGSIFRIFNGCKKSFFSKADNFGIKFPDSSNMEEKYLLMHSVVFLDFLDYYAQLLL